MGIRVNVIGGESKYKYYTVLNVNGNDHPNEDAPPAILEYSPSGSTVRIIPAWTLEDNDTTPMHNGNYASCTDIAFRVKVGNMTGSDAMRHVAIAIHDYINY